MGPLIYDPAALVIAAVAYIFALALVVRWPSVGILLVFSIYVTKSLVQMKVGPILEGYTFDMGIVILAFVGALIHRLRHGSAFHFPLPAVFVIAWFTISILMWVMIPVSRNPEYGFKKALIFSVFNTVAVTSMTLFAVSTYEVRSWLRVMVIGGVIVSAAMPLFGGSKYHVEGARQTLGLVNPLTIADFASWTVMILISGVLSFGGTKRILALVLFAPLGIVAIYLTQTRFPVVAVPPVLLVMLWMYRHRINFRVAGGAVVGLGLVAGIASFFIDTEVGGSRFRTESFQSGFDVRAEMARIAWHGIFRSPVLGNGTGDTAFQLSGGDPTYQGYPHNALLEIWNELGVIGAAAWLTIFGYSLWAGWRFQRLWAIAPPTTYFALVSSYSLLLYTLMATFKAGGYFGYTPVYMSATLVSTLHWALRRELASLGQGASAVRPELRPGVVPAVGVLAGAS